MMPDYKILLEFADLTLRKRGHINIGYSDSPTHFDSIMEQEWLSIQHDMGRGGI